MSIWSYISAASWAKLGGYAFITLAGTPFAYLQYKDLQQRATLHTRFNDGYAVPSHADDQEYLPRDDQVLRFRRDCLLPNITKKYMCRSISVLSLFRCLFLFCLHNLFIFRYYLVTGCHGVGKSTIARKAVREEISATGRVFYISVPVRFGFLLHLHLLLFLVAF
jgi:hypothetical protein